VWEDEAKLSRAQWKPDMSDSDALDEQGESEEHDKAPAPATDAFRGDDRRGLAGLLGGRRNTTACCSTWAESAA
jgi:hypothetical protein